MKKYLSAFLIAALAIAASVLIYIKLHQKTLPPNLVEGVGQIDGDLINLNAKYPGRVLRMEADEGDEVKKGQIVVRLSSREYEAKRKALLFSIKAKEEELKAKEIELEMVKETVFEEVKKASESVKNQKALLEALLKEIESQKEITAQAKRDYERIKNLFSKRLIDEHSFENASLKYEIQKNKLSSLYDKKSRVLSLLNSSESTLKQAKSSLKKIKILKHSIDALRESIKVLKAKKEELEAILEEFKIRSPIDGFVTDRVANEGEVVGGGGVLLSLIDPKSLYLKIFVDTVNEGKIKIGDKAVIFIDAYPFKPIKAKVVRIAKKAEFTPKEVPVRSDRIERVYEVDIKPLEENPHLKLGMEAIGVISFDGKGLPSSLKEIPEI